MGNVVPLARPSPNNLDVYSPVNYRPTHLCRTLIFNPTDDNQYQELFDAVAIQYAMGERHPRGYHVVELPEADGPVIRYICRRTNEGVCVKRHKALGDCQMLPKWQVNVIGYVFQFIENLETGERWEKIRGPAYEGEGESMDFTLYDVSL